MANLAGLLAANPQEHDIKAPRPYAGKNARARRRMIVSRGIAADYEAAKAGGDRGAVEQLQPRMEEAANLDSEAVNANGLRLLERKANQKRLKGGGFDPSTQVDPETVRKIGELRTEASRIGYDIRNAYKQTGQVPPEMVAKSRSYKKAADDLAAKSVGLSPEDAHNGPRWDAAGRQMLARKTMADYRRKAALGDPSAKVVASGYQRNALRQAIQRFHTLMQAFGSGRYAATYMKKATPTVTAGARGAPGGPGAAAVSAAPLRSGERGGGGAPGAVVGRSMTVLRAQKERAAGKEHREYAISMKERAEAAAAEKANKERAAGAPELRLGSADETETRKGRGYTKRSRLGGRKSDPVESKNRGPSNEQYYGTDVERMERQEMERRSR